MNFPKGVQYFKFCAYGFLKNLLFFNPFIILFLQEKGIAYFQIGVLYATREIIINVIEIPSGIVADTFGRKSSLAGSFIAYILSFLIFYFYNTYQLYLFAFVLFGIGDAFRSGTHKGMIMDFLKKEKMEKYKINYYGHTRSWSQKGSALSSIIAGFLVLHGGSYQNIFLYSTIPYILNFIMILTYPSYLNNENTSQKKKRKSIFQTLKSFVFVMKNPQVLKVVNSSALHSAYIKAVKDYIQVIIVSFAGMLPILLNFSTKQKNGIIIGTIYFIIYLLTSQASIMSAKFVVKAKNRNNYFANVTLIFGFLCGVLSGIFYTTQLWVMALIFFMGIFIAENIRKPALTGFIADQVSNEIVTSVYSAVSFIKTIMVAILAMFIGITADYFGIGAAFIIVSSSLVGITFFINILNFFKERIVE